MKLTKLMLSVGIAAIALSSCNKQDATPEISNRLKTVEVSLENVVITKGVAGDKIESGDAVQVNDFKIFLTDAAGNEYQAKNAEGTADAQTYWQTADLETAALQAKFHYVDAKCTKVIAVANLGDDLTFAEFKALENLEIGNQQDQDNLVLYDEKTLVASGTIHNDTSEGVTYISDVYTADLVLTPRISRFEVDGFVVMFKSPSKYQTIKITQLAFQNYYPETGLTTGTESGTPVNHIADFDNQSEVYSWLDTPESGTTPWYRDYFDLTLTPTDERKDTPLPLAYHFFSCDETPVFVIKLLADGQPAYLYSKRFCTTNGTEITDFEEGKIYRMHARGVAENDGSIAIDEDDIDPMDRCLDITVDVVDWAVEFVYPEF